MTHDEIIAAIEARGGRLVASFTLDADGETVGARRRNRPHHCTSCGRAGHNAARCNGEYVDPRPTYDETRRILRERSDARRAARRSR